MEKQKIKRVFSLELKKELISKIERGEIKVLEVSRIYGISTTAVYKWLYKYSDIYKKNTRVIVEKKSISKKNQELKERIAKLERVLGQKEMRVAYLEKLIEISSEDLGVDIEKKGKRLL